MKRAMGWMALALLGWAGAGAAEIGVGDVSQFEAAVGAARPGDTIVLANGAWKDVQLVFDVRGTAAAPITLRAKTAGQVALTGKSTLRIGGEHAVVSGLVFRDGGIESGSVVDFRGRGNVPAKHCRLTGSAIIGYTWPWPGPEVADPTYVRSFWVTLHGENNRVDHCWFENHDGWGVTLVVAPVVGQVAGHQIDHNYFGPRPRPPAHVKETNGYETIRIGTSGVADANARCVVEHNLFERASGEGEIISNKSCENIYRHNTFRDSDGALTLRHGHRCLVEGNFFIESAGVQTNSGGVRIVGEEHVVINNYMEGLSGRGLQSAITLMNGSKPADYVAGGYQQVIGGLVAFNTVVNCRQPLNLGARGSDPRYPDPPTGVTIANNVIQAPGQTVVTQEAAPVSANWEGNLFWGDAAGIELPAGVQWQEAGLQRGGDGLWRPGAGSPVVDAAAESYPQVTLDIDGQPRLDPKDIGCDERSEAGIVNRPLTASEVGPLWMRPRTAARPGVTAME